MDYKKLSLLVAEKLGGTVPDEVEAELWRGPPRGGPVDTAALIIALAHLAFLLAETDKTLEQLGAELQKKAESATKIAKETRDKIVKLIVGNLPWSK